MAKKNIPLDVPYSNPFELIEDFIVWRGSTGENVPLVMLSLKREIRIISKDNALKLNAGFYFMDKETRIFEMQVDEVREEDMQGTFRAIALRDGIYATLGHIIQGILRDYAQELNDETLSILSDFLLDNWTDSKEQIGLTNETSHSNNIEALISILPQNHVKPNNKLANEITKDFINEGEVELRVSRTGAKKEVITKAMLTYEGENISLSGRAKFTPYDREVHDGVVTLYVAGNEVVTPAMVYRAMNGMTETEYISPQAVGAVTRSLDKSRKTTLKIDFSQEAQAYKRDCKATYEGYLLACDKITVSTGGRTQEAYKLLRKPILYEYSQISGQIINVPIKLLQTKEAVRSTEDVIVIRGYLLRQIAGMKSPTFKRSNKITFEGVYSELNISLDAYIEAYEHDKSKMKTTTPEAYAETMYKKKTHTVRQHVEALLLEWARQTYIKGHSPYKEGKTIKGVIITL